MQFKGIPLRTIGPGSQPVEQDGKTLSYIDMPKDMSTYRAPDPSQLPGQESLRDFTAAREAVRWLGSALAEYVPGRSPKLANLSGLDADNRYIVNQILGEGEVSITCNGEIRARTQESILAGVWRTLYLDQDERVTCDLLEVADVPHYVRHNREPARTINLADTSVPEGVANAPSILVELDNYRQSYLPGAPTRVINLSLLPVSDADLAYLDHTLGRGPVEILSRSYGKCQVSATAVPAVWWVRYYNSMSTLILNTLEVTDVPQVACAAAEDIRDSATRLDEILAVCWSDAA